MPLQYNFSYIQFKLFKFINLSYSVKRKQYKTYHLLFFLWNFFLLPFFLNFSLDQSQHQNHWEMKWLHYSAVVERLAPPPWHHTSPITTMDWMSHGGQSGLDLGHFWGQNDALTSLLPSCGSSWTVFMMQQQKAGGWPLCACEQHLGCAAPIGVRLICKMFGWRVCIIWHPYECRDPRIPSRILHWSQMISAIDLNCQWF